jgi:hypothetical protein
VHENKYNYNSCNYINSKTKIIITCPKHGEFIQTPSSHLSGKGCPFCKESKGEKKIRLFLKKYKIKFTSQKTFKNCKNIRMLPFDFYIPQYNMCIEFNGEQHYRPVKYFGGEENYEKTKNNDKIKNKYCIDNNIILIIINNINEIDIKLNYLIKIP